MSKHTPGPWVLSYDQGSTRDIVSEKEQLTICMVRRSWVSPDAYQANAQLIAAAPELLEAAKLVLAWYDAEDDHSQEPDFYKRIEMCRASESAIRSAIAKAEGGAA